MKMGGKLSILALICILAAAFPNYSAADLPPPDRKAAKLAGPVRSVIAKVGPLKKKLGFWSESELRAGPRFVFDEAGRTIEATSYDERGAVTDRMTMSYDNVSNLTERVLYYRGKVMQKEIHSFDHEGRLVQKTVGEPPRRRYSYTYRSDGRIGERRHYYGPKSHKGDAPDFITNYSYDLAGNKIEEGVYFASGHLDHKTSYRYDATGRCIERAVYGSNGALRARFTTTYDANDAKGHKAEEATYKPFLAEDLLKEKKRYDSAGNVIEELSYHGGDPLTRTVIKYDARGNEVERTFYNLLYPKPKEKLRWTSSYDQHDNLTEWKQYEDGQLVESESYEYEYDNHGNWIKRLRRGVSKQSSPEGPWLGEERHVTYRTIEYY